MKILGVELAASEAKVVILDKSETGGIQAEGYYKIPLAGLTQSAARSFKDAFIGLIQAHDPQKLVLNSRGKSGNFASGAMTFAMEGILLTIDDVEIVSVAPQTLKSKIQKNLIASEYIGYPKYTAKAFQLASVGCL